VWAVAVPKLWNASFRVGDRELNARALSLRQAANYETHYLQNDIPFVSTDDPFVMNQRIIAQSGTFVVPGILTQPVEQILSDLGGERPAEWIKKFELDVDSVRPTGMSAVQNEREQCDTLSGLRPARNISTALFASIPTDGAGVSIETAQRARQVAEPTRAPRIAVRPERQERARQAATARGKRSGLATHRSRALPSAHVRPARD